MDKTSRTRGTPVSSHRGLTRAGILSMLATFTLIILAVSAPATMMGTAWADETPAPIVSETPTPAPTDPAPIPDPAPSDPAPSDPGVGLPVEPTPVPCSTVNPELNAPNCLNVIPCPTEMLADGSLPQPGPGEMYPVDCLTLIPCPTVFAPDGAIPAPGSGEMYPTNCKTLVECPTILTLEGLIPDPGAGNAYPVDCLTLIPCPTEFLADGSIASPGDGQAYPTDCLKLVPCPLEMLSDGTEPLPGDGNIFPVNCPKPIGAVDLLLGGANPNAGKPGMFALESTAVHDPFADPRGQAGDCATCHRTHIAKGKALTAQASPVSNLCFACHDGTGSDFNTQEEYIGVGVHENVPAQREYYMHNALVATSHTLSLTQEDGTRIPVEEFTGTQNRHSECTDCHNPHSLSSTQPVQTSDGWTGGGRLTGATGVAVTNNAAGQVPDYTFLNGGDKPIAFEYQLCMKCHSSYTNLVANDGFTPSQFWLDKGVESNPANPSTHPIEAQGANQTSKMNDSLSGSSAYKLWTFTSTSTIRCTNCHASQTMTDTQGAGQVAAPHVSPNRGILILPYEDRTLLASTDTWDGARFKLCFACHSDIPFETATTTATNFSLHSKHVTDIAGDSGGAASIDTPGAGNGNALCAECHYRLHSTEYPATTQDIPGTRLVSFGPNVTPFGGVLKFEVTGEGSGTCTLTCHGKEHDALGY